MKAVILAGGLGTRMAEETVVRPKPLVDVGGRPILWHIMMHYSVYGVSEFVLALGYKSELIKRFFADEFHLRGSLTIDYASREMTQMESRPDYEDDWRVHLMETGLSTPTGGRLSKVAPLLQDGTFMMTFGDGVSDVNLDDLLSFHRSHGRLATVTAVRPPGRFGELDMDGDNVRSFLEKPLNGESWISGGFFVLEPGVFNYVNDHCDWSKDCLPKLATDGELKAYKHTSFWQCMDTIQERTYLESLWEQGQAPWRTW